MNRLTWCSVIPQVRIPARTSGEPLPKPRDSKRQEILDLVAAEREVNGPETPNVVPCGALDEPTVQFRIPRQQAFTNFPARESFTPAQMVETRLRTIDQFPDDPGNDAGRKRAAELVGIECHLLAGLSGTTHILDKTSVAGLRSSGSQDNPNDSMSGILQDGLFRFQFGPAIYVEWVRFIRLAIPAGPSVKNFPAGQKNKWNVP